MKRLLIIILTLNLLTLTTYAGNNPEASGKKVISGYIKDKTNGEGLIGAAIYIKELKTGTATNTYGFYSLSLEPNKYTMICSYVGYETTEIVVDLKSNNEVNIELNPKNILMKEIEVTDTRSNENVSSNEMSVMTMKAETIRKVPALLGEVDVIKVLQMLPGVQAAGEGTSGFNVRGGSSDQNLIMLDEATVYNASHLMGFFSVFNNDALKEMKLYKGDIPAEQGGRLASLLDIRQKEGNMKNFSASGGIGTISSRLTLEGPIIKDKTSILIAGRRSYADLFLPLSSNKDIRNNSLYFYDVNIKLNHTFNQNNRLFISRYFGRDVMKSGGEEPFGINWGNSTLTARWNHLFSSKLFSNFSFVSSNYDYYMGLESAIQGFKWTANMIDHTLRADFGYYINPENTLKFGATTTYHTYQPGLTKGSGEGSIFNELKIPSSNALEHGIYISNDQEVNALLSVGYGLRLSVFQNMGQAMVYNYNSNYDKVDSTVYGKNEIYNTYKGLEPRLNVKYTLSETSSIKASYSRTMQYIQLATNSTVGTPLDIWLPASPNIKPQACNQVALGYFKNFRKNMFETSVEVYYKRMNNQIDFKDHAQLLMNPTIEGEIRTGKAESMGVELLVRKNTGKLTGWIGYTYARAYRKMELINEGRRYNAPYDRPHDLSIVLNYEFTKRLNVSATWIYITGSPVTFPTGRFEYGNMIAPVYSDRNSYRMPDYHRMDLGINWESKDKPNRKWHSTWNLSIYNAYNRHNAFSITFRQSESNQNITEAYKTYLFPIIPAITYNFKF